MLGAECATPDFGFVFDIDGVLLRSSRPLPGAANALSLLARERVPFLLLTNGGGQTESERIDKLNDVLGTSLDVGRIVQSHTPFQELVRGRGFGQDGQHGRHIDPLEKKTVLVVGGAGDKCRHVAHEYGFKSVVTPGDIYRQHPDIWPFSTAFNDYYASITRPLPLPVMTGAADAPSLKIDAILVFNDPRDWALDIQIIIDVLLSHKGFIGSLSEKNGRNDLPNMGYQQDGQPSLYVSNPDVLWAAQYHQARLGQGGFLAALEGTWKAVTGGADLRKTVIGKPHQYSYEYAEKRLLRQQRQQQDDGTVAAVKPLKSVYMVGDNPASDIQGANGYRSPWGSSWKSILVRSGVYTGGQPAHTPTVIVDGVGEAVQWALAESKWEAAGVNRQQAAQQQVTA
ncbi:hypothetical protein KEM52_004911 [Ascosphaera acerosa]|nr:hypothetical protein KEM52_004911 [Ascosphaera acerosa]